MATESTALPGLNVSRKETSHKLEAQISNGEQIKSQPIRTRDDLSLIEKKRDRWTDFNIALLATLFDNQTFADNHRRFTSKLFSPDFTLDEDVERLRASIDKEINQIRSYIEILPLLSESEESEGGSPQAKGNPEYASELYEKVVALYQNRDQLNKETAAEIVQLADDAIAEFGTTNQKKKVELTTIKKDLEDLLPPLTIEALRKRAEEYVLTRAYPRRRTLQRILLTVIFVIVIAGIALVVIEGVSKLKSQHREATPSDSPDKTQKSNSDQINKPGPAIQDVQYTGRVTDGHTHKAVCNAKVAIEPEQQVPQILYTDSEGVFHLVLPASTKSIRIRVEAINYEVIDRNVTLSRTGLEDIRLTPSTGPSRRRPSPEIAAQQLKREGQNLMNQGRYNDAIRKFEKALTIPGISSTLESELQELRIRATTRNGKKE